MSLWFLFVVLGAYLVLRGSQGASAKALAIGLLLTGVDHLLAASWYVSVMADWIPQKQPIVLLSAVARIVLAVLLWPTFSREGAIWGTLALLIVVLPVNLRIASDPSAIPPVADWSAAKRWVRLALHSGWIAWTVGALVVARQRREAAAK